MSLLEFSERPRVNEPRVVYNYPSTHKWTYPSPTGNLLPVIEEKRNANFSNRAGDSTIAEENIIQANAPGKNAENDVLLLEYCVWRWKWSLCFILFLPYWIAAVYWDYKSAENKRNDPEQKHYSAWVVNTVFAILVVCLLSNLCRRRFCMNLDSFGQDSQGIVCRPDLWLLQNVSDLSERVQCLIVLIAVGFWIFWILIECGSDFAKWQCLLGLCFFVLLSAAISLYPTRINYRPVIWGLFFQWILGFSVLRTRMGGALFRLQNDWITSFISYSNLGNEMVGDEMFSYEDFAFRVIPTVIFFSATVSLLYYLGILQRVIGGVSWFMNLTLGTSAAESFASFANIFIGQTEAAILIAPFLKTMTYSEINTVMTSGFATISGSALMLYAIYGIQSQWLLAAGVMSAPAAIAIAKIVYPETEEIAAAPEQGENEDKSRSLLDAITRGALRTIMIVANILVLLIAFIGAINFANSCIGYLGERVGLVEDAKISFIKLCGWILYPLCWLMGVPGEDCFIVGELLGYKIFASELVAYKEMICSYQEEEGIGDRAVYIATFALSGFSSLAAIGIQIGTLLHLAPEKNQEVISIAFRAMISGNLACFMTACVAGILTNGVPVQDSMALNCSD